MPHWIGPGDEFRDVVLGYNHTSFRWEAQPAYHEPVEDEPFRLWQEGRPDNSWLAHWMGRIRGMRLAGKRFERVRKLADTKYQRRLRSFTHLNNEAGEDIRWITPTDADNLSLPGYDFYLLDDNRVLKMHFGDQGVAGAEVLTDSAALAHHQRYRDLAWSKAIRHVD